MFVEVIGGKCFVVKGSVSVKLRVGVMINSLVVVKCLGFFS